LKNLLSFLVLFSAVVYADHGTITKGRASEPSTEQIASANWSKTFAATRENSTYDSAYFSAIDSLSADVRYHENYCARQGGTFKKREELASAEKRSRGKQTYWRVDVYVHVYCTF
jgi:hypothetical protein